MNMRRGIKYPTSRIKTVGVLRECVSMEEFLRKALNGNEPVQATSKMTYNDRKDGVLPQHDIRTDRFDLAMMATDKIHATQAAARHSADFPEMQKAAEEQAKSGQAAGEA